MAPQGGGVARWVQRPTRPCRPRTKSPSDILHEDGDVKTYVEIIWLTVLKLGKGKPTNSCPPYGSLHNHVRRSRSCCSIVSSWITIENGLTLYADIEFVGVPPGEPDSPGSAEGQECPMLKLHERATMG